MQRLQEKRGLEHATPCDQGKRICQRPANMSRRKRDTDSMRGMMGGDVSEGVMLCKADACVSVSKRRWGDDESPSRRWVEERQAGL